MRIIFLLYRAELASNAVQSLIQKHAPSAIRHTPFYQTAIPTQVIDVPYRVPPANVMLHTPQSRQTAVRFQGTGTDTNFAILGTPAFIANR